MHARPPGALPARPCPSGLPPPRLCSSRSPPSHRLPARTPPPPSPRPPSPPSGLLPRLRRCAANHCSNSTSTSMLPASEAAPLALRRAELRAPPPPQVLQPRLPPLPLLLVLLPALRPPTSSPEPLLPRPLLPPARAPLPRRDRPPADVARSRGPSGESLLRTWHAASGEESRRLLLHWEEAAESLPAGRAQGPTGEGVEQGDRHLHWRESRVGLDRSHDHTALMLIVRRNTRIVLDDTHCWEQFSLFLTHYNAMTKLRGWGYIYIGLVGS